MLFRILSSLFMRRGGKLGLLFAAYQLLKGRRGSRSYGRRPYRSTKQRMIEEAARAVLNRSRRY